MPEVRFVDSAYLFTVYIEQHAGRATLYGEAYRIADGRLTQICREGEALELGEAL